MTVDKPHNAMVDTGALVCASLFKNTERPADRFEYVNIVISSLTTLLYIINIVGCFYVIFFFLFQTINRYQQLAGGEYVGFNNSV